MSERASEAYAVLSNLERHAAYDRTLSRTVTRQT